MKDKKKLVAALNGIKSSLRRGYNLLNQEGHLPEVEDESLAVLAHHIVKALDKEIGELQENERFEGLTPEEILDKRQEEREAEIEKMVSQAGEALKLMRTPDPVDEVEVVEAPEADLDEDPDDTGEGTGGGSDPADE